MARNGSGTFVTPNTFVAGTTITAASHNENWSDAASEITNSLALDGQSAMTAPIKASNGSVAAPSISFDSDTDSGIYRIGGNNIGVAVGGNKILDVDNDGLGVTGGIYNNGFRMPSLLIASTFSVTSALSIVLTTFSDFRAFRFVLTDVTTTAAVSILMRTSTDGGANYDSGGSDYGYIRQLVDSNTGTLTVLKSSAADSASVGFSDVNANDTLAFETTIYAMSSSRYKLFKTNSYDEISKTYFTK